MSLDQNIFFYMVTYSSSCNNNLSSAIIENMQAVHTKHAFAVLFALGGIVSTDALSKALEVDIAEIPCIIEQLKSSVYCQPESPVSVEEVGEGYCLVTRPAYGEIIRRGGLENNISEKFSAAAIETLAIIAWLQPITKSAIDKIRNTDSEKTINRLNACGMVNQIGDLNKPGSPGVFQTTEKFLEHFGLKNLQALPDLPDLNL